MEPQPQPQGWKKDITTFGSNKGIPSFSANDVLLRADSSVDFLDEFSSREFFNVPLWEQSMKRSSSSIPTPNENPSALSSSLTSTSFDVSLGLDDDAVALRSSSFDYPEVTAPPKKRRYLKLSGEIAPVTAPETLGKSQAIHLMEYFRDPSESISGQVSNSASENQSTTKDHNSQVITSPLNSQHAGVSILRTSSDSSSTSAEGIPLRTDTSANGGSSLGSLSVKFSSPISTEFASVVGAQTSEDKSHGPLLSPLQHLAAPSFDQSLATVSMDPHGTIAKISSEDWADCWGVKWAANSTDANDGDISYFHFSASLDEPMTSMLPQTAMAAPRLSSYKSNGAKSRVASKPTRSKSSTASSGSIPNSTHQASTIFIADGWTSATPSVISMLSTIPDPVHHLENANRVKLLTANSTAAAMSHLEPGVHQPSGLLAPTSIHPEAAVGISPNKIDSSGRIQTSDDISNTMFHGTRWRGTGPGQSRSVIDASDLPYTQGNGGGNSSRERGKYRCGRCGQPKVNHNCEYVEEVTMFSTASQVTTPVINLQTWQPIDGAKYLSISSRQSIQEPLSSASSTVAPYAMSNVIVDSSQPQIFCQEVKELTQVVSADRHVSNSVNLELPMAGPYRVIPGFIPDSVIANTIPNTRAESIVPVATVPSTSVPRTSSAGTHSRKQSDVKISKVGSNAELPPVLVVGSSLTTPLPAIPPIPTYDHLALDAIANASKLRASSVPASSHPVMTLSTHSTSVVEKYPLSGGLLLGGTLPSTQSILHMPAFLGGAPLLPPLPPQTLTSAINPTVPTVPLSISVPEISSPPNQTQSRPLSTTLATASVIPPGAGSTSAPPASLADLIMSSLTSSAVGQQFLSQLQQQLAQTSSGPSLDPQATIITSAILSSLGKIGSESSASSSSALDALAVLSTMQTSNPSTSSTSTSPTAATTSQ